MNEFSIKLVGYEKIRRALDILPANLQKQALRAGVRAGAKEIRDIARSKARKRTGRLTKAIIHQLRRGTKDTVIASVGWDYKKSRVGHLIEFGHAIVPRGKKGQSNRGGTSIGHVPAYPHLRPALVEGQWRALREVRLAVKRWIFARAARA